ncbi:MAG: hypothetical protein V4647_09520, partial [Pseudomonadota bacterium]
MDDLSLRLQDASGDGSRHEGTGQLAMPLDDDRQEELVLPAPTPASAPPPAPAPRVTAEPTIPSGRELTLSDFNPPEIGAGERLIRLAYRFGVPGSTLASPFRKAVRPRLLATVESSLPGDRVAGMALRAGHFLVNGVKAPITQVDCAPAAKLTPPFERTVHGFTWLRDLSTSGTTGQCAPTAQRILGQWLAANPGGSKGGPKGI